jgi:hypothetical protein
MASLEEHPFILDSQVAGLLQHKLMAMGDVFMTAKADNDATRKSFECIERMHVGSVSRRSGKKRSNPVTDVLYLPVITYAKYIQ